MNQDIYVYIEHIRDHVSDISFMLLAQAWELAHVTGGRVIALLLGHQGSGLARDLLAEKVLYVDHPALEEYSWDASLKTLAAMISESMPRAVLFGDTTIGAEVAGGLSMRLKLPLVSYCLNLRAEGSAIHYTSQICGGKIIARGDLPSETTLVTMMAGKLKVAQGKSTQPPTVMSRSVPAMEGLRVSLKQYIEPPSGDIDITKEPILVGIGRGIEREDNLDQVKELADALGGTVCASRPVVDQGWLPSTRLVGKSGRTVKPKLYLALGISGAPEHTESITGSDLIIAVNTDPAAPIFNLAKYGAQMDIFDLLPALTETVHQAKGG